MGILMNSDFFKDWYWHNIGRRLMYGRTMSRGMEHVSPDMRRIAGHAKWVPIPFITTSKEFADALEKTYG